MNSRSTVIVTSVKWLPYLLRIHKKQSLYRSSGFQGAEDPIISRQYAHEGGKIVSLTHRPPLLLRKYSWYSSMLNFYDIIGNRTLDLPPCTAVSQQTAPPRASC